MLDLSVSIPLDDDVTLLSLLSTLESSTYEALVGRLGLWIPKVLQRLKNYIGMDACIPETWRALGLLIHHARNAELDIWDVPLEGAFTTFAPALSGDVPEVDDFCRSWAGYIVKLKKDACEFWEFAKNVSVSRPDKLGVVLDASLTIARKAHVDKNLECLQAALTLLLRATERLELELACKAWGTLDMFVARSDAVGDVTRRFYIDDIVLRMVLFWKRHCWTPELHKVACALGNSLHSPLAELDQVPTLSVFCDKARLSSVGLD